MIHNRATHGYLFKELSIPNKFIISVKRSMMKCDAQHPARKSRSIIEGKKKGSS
jgi:hypothetical protein